MSTVYVVTHGKCVESVRHDEDAAKRDALRVLDHVEIVEHEWRETMLADAELYYRPARSGRWNASNVRITAKTLAEEVSE
ncbi:hypothetical protein ACH4S8_38015 [Streptomyces sp. NPDC021080]|uniref:hypothetical protein n=1 Tax=Streptomyces sp. NPDC021080 TaxID=3365110 RepID=UPI00379FF649